MDLARAPRRARLTARKKGSGYENGYRRKINLVPRHFPLRASLGKDPGPGWSRVSQILGDNKLFAQGWGAKFVLPI